MKLVQITLGSRTYPLCYSLSVVRATEETYGSMEALFQDMAGAIAENGGEDIAPPAQPGGVRLMDTFSHIVWLLRQMMDAGYQYARLEGEAPPALPAEEELLLLLGPADLPEVQQKLLEAMGHDSRRNVEVTAPKNEGATPAEI